MFRSLNKAEVHKKNSQFLHILRRPTNVASECINFLFISIRSAHWWLL
nr:MAG TPA: hypothetical protein [Caudoviricetes sp.]